MPKNHRDSQMMRRQKHLFLKDGQTESRTESLLSKAVRIITTTQNIGVSSQTRQGSAI